MDNLNLMDIANELLIVNQTTIDKLCSLDNAFDCLALYIFYYKTAKWQKTDTIKASDTYVMKTLKIGKEKLTKTKNILKTNGLIEIIQQRTNGKIDGWYIKIHYIISENTTKKIKVETINNHQNQEVGNSTSGFQDTNALREQIKCLKKENKILKEEINKLISKKETKKISKPTIDEIKIYCQERNNKIDAEHFYDYYEANGWKVGRNPMKDWKATIRTWEKNNKQVESNVMTYQERVISQQEKARQEFLNGG